MKEVQKARYNVLDTQMSSFSRQPTTRKAVDGITTVIERNVLLESQLQNAKDAHSKYDSLLEAHTHLQAEYRIAKRDQIQLEELRYDIKTKRNTSDQENNCLERRLEASENVAKTDRSQLREASIRQSDLMNLNYKLKRDNLKLARGSIGFKEIEEYLRLTTATSDQPTDSWGLRENHFTLGVSDKKPERAYEIVQETHKDLKSKLQQANLKVYEMQQKLSEPQEFEASSTILDSRPYKFNLRPLDIGRAGRSASDLDKMEFVDLTRTEPAQGRAILQRGVDRRPTHDAGATCITDSSASTATGTDASTTSLTRVTVAYSCTTCDRCEWKHSERNGSD
jgi:hypothetical protein